MAEVGGSNPLSGHSYAWVAQWKEHRPQENTYWCRSKLTTLCHELPNQETSTIFPKMLV